jgi:glycosyltransferase involved in cell wall biosynthesis
LSHRILFVAETLFSLGAAQQLKLLADALTEAGHEIHVAVLGQRTGQPTEWTDAGIKIHFLNGDDTTPLHTMRDGFFVVKQLRRLIQTLAPEIVHTWCGQAELLTLLATADAPLLSPLPPFRLLSTELFLQPEKRLTRQLIENRMNDRVERMIVPHESAKQHLVDNGYEESRIQVIPNSTPTPVIDRAQARQEMLDALGLPETTFLAGAVAPLQHRTRLKDLIWATDLLTCIREDFHFVMVGEGTQLQPLKRFAALTESKSHIHFLGHPKSAERVIAGLDFYWHSHLRDPVSGVLLTAMGQGVPAISVFGQGTKEIIHHQETGFAVNFGARDEFARWTKFMIEKPDSKHKLANQGRDFVRQNFQVSSMVEAYLEIYRK